MLKKILKVLMVGLITASSCCWGDIEREVSIKLVEERINGVLFLSRIDTTTGTKVPHSRVMSWAIDGKEVTREEYNERIDQARLAQLKEERERQERQEQARYAFNQAQRCALLRTLGQQYLAEIDAVCAQFDRYHLRDQLAYSASTIPSEVEFVTFKDHYVEAARQLFKTADDELLIEKAQQVIERLERSVKSIQQLFEATVKKAINHCSDTERLKKLLELVS